MTVGMGICNKGIIKAMSFYFVHLLCLLHASMPVSMFVHFVARVISGRKKWLKVACPLSPSSPELNQIQISIFF